MTSLATCTEQIKKSYEWVTILACSKSFIESIIVLQVWSEVFV